MLKKRFAAAVDVRKVVCMLAIAVGAAGVFTPPGVRAANIVEEWAAVKAPPAPELKAVAIEAKTTALLMLDFLPPNCGARPRCVASLPVMKKLLEDARASGVTVIHTVFGKLTPADIPKEVAATPNEPWVSSFADKFLNTDLEKILKGKGIETVIVAGTAANGAVLYTGSGAELRGFKVIVPVDGISSLDTYSEQFGVWQLANGPTFSARVTLSRTDLIKF